MAAASPATPRAFAWNLQGAPRSATVRRIHAAGVAWNGAARACLRVLVLEVRVAAGVFIVKEHLFAHDEGTAGVRDDCMFQAVVRVCAMEGTCKELSTLGDCNEEF